HLDPLLFWAVDARASSAAPSSLACRNRVRAGRSERLDGQGDVRHARSRNQLVYAVGRTAGRLRRIFATGRLLLRPDLLKAAAFLQDLAGKRLRSPDRALLGED